MSESLRKIRYWLQILFILLALFAFAYYIRLHWNDVLTVIRGTPAAVLLGATLVTLSGYVLRGLMWSVMLQAITGIHLGGLGAFRVSSISWMGRYLPGKVWALAGKACLSAGSPEQIPATTVAVAVDTIWFELSGLFLACLCGLFSLQLDGAFRGYFAVAAVVLPVGLLLCHPRVYCPVANFFLRRLGKPPLQRNPSTWLMLLLLLSNSLTYILWSLGLIILLSPHKTFSGFDYLAVTMTLSLAWVSGFIVLIAPAGIGVRDAVIAMGLGVLVGFEPGSIVLAVLGSRVLSTLSELLCFVAGSLIPAQRLSLQCEPAATTGHLTQEINPDQDQQRLHRPEIPDVDGQDQRNQPDVD
jgi:glycosyltransferase 2 family protein